MSFQSNKCHMFSHISFQKHIFPDEGRVPLFASDRTSLRKLAYPESRLNEK